MQCDPFHGELLQTVFESFELKKVVILIKIVFGNHFRVVVKTAGTKNNKMTISLPTHNAPT